MGRLDSLLSTDRTTLTPPHCSSPSLEVGDTKPTSEARCADAPTKATTHYEAPLEQGWLDWVSCAICFGGHDTGNDEGATRKCTYELRQTYYEPVQLKKWSDFWKIGFAPWEAPVVSSQLKRLFSQGAIGGRCIEVGCGRGVCTRWLAAKVSTVRSFVQMLTIPRPHRCRVGKRSVLILWRGQLEAGVPS
jgi:hypothetical protein